MKKMCSIAPIIKKMAPVLLVSAFLLPLPARAEIKAGSVELSPFAGYNFFEKGQNLENSPVFGGRVGYNITNTFAIEGTGEFTRSHVDNKSTSFSREGQFTTPIDGVSITRYHLDLLYHFMPESKFNPFIVAGYGASHFNPRINSKNMSTPNFGVGAKYWMSDNIALRLDVRDNMAWDERIHSVETTLGVVFALGGKSTQATQPVDSDGDGVSDALDKCSGTPQGVSVDSNGCPLDSDQDGVVDYLDKCPGTPAGAKVDMYGCPVDSDKDGVPDYLDRCSRTPAGVKVDSTGCPVVVMTIESKAAAAKRFCSKPAVLSINFDTNKTDIKSQYYDELKTVGDFLTYFPNAKGEIAGHADPVGTKSHNQTLSQGRADSVRQYIVDTFGTDSARIGTKGYGYSKPVASNKTEAGRAKNRRIEANFTCE